MSEIRVSDRDDQQCENEAERLSTDDRDCDGGTLFRAGARPMATGISPATMEKECILQVITPIDYEVRHASASSADEANRSGCAPILMTSFSIVPGVIPVAIGLGAGSEQRAPSQSRSSVDRRSALLTLLSSLSAYSISLISRRYPGANIRRCSGAACECNFRGVLDCSEVRVAKLREFDFI